MGRKLLGYRVRGTSNGKRVYVCKSWDGSGFHWDGEIVPDVESPDDCRARMNEALKEPINIFGRKIVVENPKIVAVYLKTNEYTSNFAEARVREDLSDFNRAVVDEIDRRDIDAIVEPEDFGGLPTTFRFRAPNGAWIWIPIIACAVVDGPKEERAKKTVDRMLSAIQDVASSTLVHLRS
jgi:hypothetical protein